MHTAQILPHTPPLLNAPTQHLAHVSTNTIHTIQVCVNSVQKCNSSLGLTEFHKSESSQNYLPHPPLLPYCLCLTHSSQKLSHCFSQCDLSQHSSTSKSKGRQNTHCWYWQSDQKRTTEGNMVTIHDLKPPQSCSVHPAPQDDKQMNKQRPLKRRGKLIMNLLHVVSRRSLHVAFHTSRTLPENRNPAATWYVPPTYMAKREGHWKGERERKNKGGIYSSSHDGMTSENWSMALWVLLSHNHEVSNKLFNCDYWVSCFMLPNVRQTHIPLINEFITEIFIYLKNVLL